MKTKKESVRVLFLFSYRYGYGVEPETPRRGGEGARRPGDAGIAPTGAKRRIQIPLSLLYEKKNP